jgi:hypothetical protein
MGALMGFGPKVQEYPEQKDPLNLPRIQPKFLL